jgi:hypothetical protein
LTPGHSEVFFALAGNRYPAEVILVRAGLSRSAAD